MDTNVIAYHVAPGPGTDATDALLTLDPDWVAPALWRSELRNVLVRQCRTGRLAWDAAPSLMGHAERRMRITAPELPSSRVLAFARRAGCTAYDAEFGALAEALAVPLVTADRALLTALPGQAFTPDAFVRRTGPRQEDEG